MTKYTIILPVFNEQSVIKKSVKYLNGFLEKRLPDYQIVIANNGSTDNTGLIAMELDRSSEKIVHLNVHEKGRGVALKEVVSKIKGEWYVYLDIDIPINEEDILNIFTYIETENADLVVLKRKGKRQIHRKFLTFVMGWLTRVLLNFKYSDPQSGVKFFSWKVASVLKDCHETGYFMDTEMIKLAHMRGYKVCEYEADWIDTRFEDRTTKVNYIADSIRALKAVVRVDWGYEKNILEMLKILLTFGSFLGFLSILIFTDNFGFLIKGPPYELPLDLIVMLLMGFSAFGIVLWRVMLKSNLPYKRTLRVVLFFYILAVLLTLFIKPTFSQDAYWNLLFSKGYIFEGANPYLSTSKDFSNFSLYRYIHVWDNFSMTHGPISVYYYALPYLFLTSDIGAIMILRLVSAGLILFTAHLTLRSLGSNLSDRYRILVFTVFLFSPLLFVNGLVELHNDILVMFFISASYYFVKNDKYLPSMIMLILGFSTKYVPFLLLPIPIIKLWRSNLSAKTKTLTILAGIIISGVVLYILYFPFGGSFPFPYRGINLQTNMIVVAQMSPLTYVLLKYAGYSPVLLKAIGLVVTIILVSLFSLKGKYLEAYVIPIMILLLAYTNWLMSWYFLWIFPLALIANKNIQHVVVFTSFIFLGTFLFPIFISVLFFALYLVIAEVIKNV